MFAYLDFDAVSSYLLAVALATLLVAILVWQPHRSGRTIIVWLASGVVGVLLGLAGSYAAMQLADFELTKRVPRVSGGSMGGPGGGPGMGGKMGGGMGGMKGMGGMGMGGMKGMGGMGGPAAPRPKRELTTLVQKLDLLTGDIAITLTPEQAASLRDCLKDVEKPAKMTDDEAEAKHDRLLAMLTESQKVRLEAIGLPRPARGGPGMGGPGMGGPGMGGPGMGGPGMGGPGMGGPGMPGMKGGGAAPKQNEDQNPFQQDAEGKAVKSLLQRFAAQSAPPKAEPAKAPPATTETQKAAPPKVEAPKAPPAKADAAKSPAKKP
jgi:hypothetical protein